MATTFSPTSSVLAHLKENTRLQTSLAEQKIRSDRHRNNFELLKVQHGQLQENCRRTEEELATGRRHKIESDQRTRETISRLSEERDYANSLVDQLRAQALTPQKEEIIRDEITEALSSQYQERLNVLQKEVDDAKTKLMRAQYDSQYMRTELDHERKEHQRGMADLMERHRLEIQHLSEDQGSVSERLQQENVDYSQRYLGLQRENTQLKARVASLDAEMEECRATEVYADSRLTETTENNEMVLSHVKASLCTSEQSLEGANKQIQSLQAMIADMRREQEMLRGRSQELEVQHIDDSSKLHNAQRHFKKELAVFQQQSMQSCSELESKCSALAGEVRTVRCRADENQMSAEQAARRLKSKEEELSLRLQAVREEEWKRIAALEQEKLDVEARLSEEERTRRGLEERLATETESLQEKLHRLAEEKNRCGGDADRMRQHGSQLQERVAHLEKERNALRETDKLYRDLQLQHRRLQGIEQELEANNRQLQSAMDVLQQQFDGAHFEARDTEKQHSQAMEELQLTNQKQEANAQSRVDELQRLNANLQAEVQKAITKAKKIKHQCRGREQESMEKIEILQARLAHQDQEKALIRSQLEGEVNQLRHKLKEVLRRQGEFSFLLHGAGRAGPGPVAAVAALPFTAPVIAAPHSKAASSDSDGGGRQTKMHQQDLTSVHRRLASLASAKPPPAPQPKTTAYQAGATLQLRGNKRPGAEEHPQGGDIEHPSDGSLSSTYDLTDED